MSTMPRRFVWIDDSDIYSAKAKLKAVREKQIPDWKWVRWVEDDYDSAEDAYQGLVAEIGVPSMFNVGKAVYFYGLPKAHARLAEHLTQIPDGIVVVMVARLNKTLSLYKSTLELKDKRGIIIELPEFASSDGPYSREHHWVVNRSAALGRSIDNLAAAELLKIFGFVPNILHQEIKKLSSLAKDGVISLWMVEQACQGSCAVDTRDLGEAMLNGDVVRAHALMSRLLARNEPPHLFLGWLHRWSLDLCLAAESESISDEKMNRLIGNCLKWEKAEKKTGKKDEPAEPSKDEENADFGKGKSVKMFASPNFLYYSRKALAQSGRGLLWATDALYLVVEMQVDLRRYELLTMENKHLLSEFMHNVIDKITGEQK